MQKPSTACQWMLESGSLLGKVRVPKTSPNMQHVCKDARALMKLKLRYGCSVVQVLYRPLVWYLKTAIPSA